MNHRISPDFRHVAAAAQADLDLASQARKKPRQGPLHQLQVADSDNDPLIPRGSVVYFRAEHPRNLRRGSFVVVRRGLAMQLRRLIRLDVSGSGSTLHLATYNGRVDSPVPGRHLVGSVVNVRTTQAMFDPSREGGLQALRNFLTDYNTCSPLQRLGRIFSGPSENRENWLAS